MVEQQFTKDQILEIYLNHIYFGCGIYGIQAAAQRFWQKDVQQLSLDEAATLARDVARILRRSGVAFWIRLRFRKYELAR